MILGNESDEFTMRGFGTREHPDPAVRPQLLIDFVPPAPASFCDDADGSLAACPCGNPGAPDAGCDLPQSTGGVRLDVLAQDTGPANRVTLQGVGFPSNVCK